MTPKEMAESRQGAFSRAVLSGFAEALSSACGSAWLMAALSSESGEDDSEEKVSFLVQVEGDLVGFFAVSLRRSDAIVVAASMLQEEEGDYGEIEKAALQELVHVATERIKPEKNEKYKKLTFTVSGEEELPETACTYEGEISSEEGKRALVAIRLNPELNEALTEVEEEASKEEAPEKAPAAKIEEKEAISTEGLNLDLVMDVELNVTLRFGKRQLALRDVLELTTGSVVELDRQVEEPVELLLNGVVIAKGEAVVIDGNYGLRVTDVIHPVSSSMLRNVSKDRQQAAVA